MTYPKNFRSNELTLNDNTFQKNTSNLSPKSNKFNW